MRNNQRYERGLEDELRLIGEIQEIGFRLRNDMNVENNWTRSYFGIRIENGVLNNAALTLHTHPNLGVNVSLIPQPFSTKYHFRTDGPIGDPEALDHIKSWLEGARNGRTYEPSL